MRVLGKTGLFGADRRGLGRALAVRGVRGEAANRAKTSGEQFYISVKTAKSCEWSCYEGSYVEVGGKRISDVKQIMPCIIETLEKAERVEKLAQERVEEIHRSEKEIEEKELLVSE